MFLKCNYRFVEIEWDVWVVKCLEFFESGFLFFNIGNFYRVVDVRM